MSECSVSGISQTGRENTGADVAERKVFGEVDRLAPKRGGRLSVHASNHSELVKRRIASFHRGQAQLELRFMGKR